MLKFTPKANCKQIPPETALPLWEEIMSTVPLFKKGPIPKTIEWKWEFNGKTYHAHKIREEADGYVNDRYYSKTTEFMYVTTIHGSLIFEFLVEGFSSFNPETSKYDVTKTAQAQTTLPLKDLLYWRLRKK